MLQSVCDSPANNRARIPARLYVETKVPINKWYEHFNLSKLNEREQLRAAKHKEYREQFKPQVIEKSGNKIRFFTGIGVLSGMFLSPIIISSAYNKIIVRGLSFSLSSFLFFKITFYILDLIAKSNVFLCLFGSIVISCILCSILNMSISSSFRDLLNNIEISFLRFILFFITITSFTIGTGLTIGLSNVWVIVSLIITGGGLVATLFYPSYKNKKLIAQYRQQESKYLIKP